MGERPREMFEVAKPYSDQYPLKTASCDPMSF